MTVKILLGDCRDTLKTLPDQSVHTCVTSPPYFGLRDYGTASWEGGTDPECDHKIPSGEHDPKRGMTDAVSSHTLRFNKTHCYKCGAKRVDSQIGLEPTPDEFVSELVSVFREVRRVLRDDGTLWLNIGDSYAAAGGAQVQGTKQTKGSQSGAWNGETRKPPAGIKSKDLMGIPWMLAFALRADGWYLRQDIIWHKPNPMPESVQDRCTKSHEYIFLLSKSPQYYFDHEAIKEDGVIPAGTKGAKGSEERQNQKGVNSRPPEYKIYDGKRNKRSVWTVNTKPFKGAHFATFPVNLIEPCILAGCPEGGTVLDPFGGAGTTGLVANNHNRNAILCELNPDYSEIANARITTSNGMFSASDVEMVK